MKIGTTRIVRRFALFPVFLDDGTRIWLRFYKQEKKWWPMVLGLEPSQDMLDIAHQYTLWDWRTFRSYI